MTAGKLIIQCHFPFFFWPFQWENGYPFNTRFVLNSLHMLYIVLNKTSKKPLFQSEINLYVNRLNSEESVIPYEYDQ
jgi:hypothetical protein